MPIVGELLQFVGGIGILVCFIMVLIKMFQNGQTGLGIACIVLAFCGGLGVLIAFIYGWVKSSDWGLKNVMLIWTASWVIAIVGGIMTPPTVYYYQGPGGPVAPAQ